MATGKAKKVSYLEVEFFDWSRYNINSTTELARWAKSFDQNVNEFFGVNEEGDGLTIKTPMGEHKDVNPGDIIIRDSANGTYFTMSARLFSSSYEVTEESGEAVEATP